MMTSLSATTVDVRTVKGGSEYRVTWKGHSYLFALAEQNGEPMVTVYGRVNSCGSYKLSRFGTGDKLSPENIRAFFSTEVTR